MRLFLLKLRIAYRKWRVRRAAKVLCEPAMRGLSFGTVSDDGVFHPYGVYACNAVWEVAPSKHDGRTKYQARLARIKAGRSRKPDPKPFKNYARSKAIKAFEHECILRRCPIVAEFGGVPYGQSFLTAMFKWIYGDKRAPDEVLWFGQPPSLETYLMGTFQLWETFAKESFFDAKANTGDGYDIPVKFGWR